MAAKPYTTLQDILEEAGLAVDIHGETPAGDADGTNKIFTVANKPLTDANYDDQVTIDDLKLYYNGVPQTIASVDVAFGIITAATAPAEGVDVTVDYRYSAVSLAFVSKLRDEAEEVINNRMKLVDSCVPYGATESDEVPKSVRGIARQLAAAWLLIRDYGFNQDIEGTSKDGYKKLETAEKALEAYAMSGGKCGSDGNGTPSGGTGAFQASSDGDLFPEPDFKDTCPPEKDW